MSLALATSALRRSLAPLALRGSRLALPKFAPVAALGARHAGTFKHHNTSDNSTESKFEFDEESEKEIAFTLSKYPDTLQGKQSAIMPMLWIVQQQLDKAHPTMKFKHADPNATKFPKSQGGGGWVPISAMHAIADRLGCSHMEVYEVATFFTSITATSSASSTSSSAPPRRAWSAAPMTSCTRSRRTSGSRRERPPPTACGP